MNTDYIDFSKNKLSAKNLIEKILGLADKNSTININWQNTGNQLIVQTKNYFYKIYKTSYSNIFFSIIRNKLGQIYREKYDLLWDNYSINEQDSIYEFQLRQKIHSFTIQEISFNEILQNWKQPQMLLEKKLRFNLIAKELKFYFNDINTLILLRDQINKNNDFGIYHDNIILLDDADFFIGLLDKNNNLLEKPFGFYNCQSIGENFILSKYSYDFFKDTYLNNTYIYNKWMIYNFRYISNRQLNTNFFSENQKHLQNAIKYIGEIYGK